jgi:hypothetical protein
MSSTRKSSLSRRESIEDGSRWLWQKRIPKSEKNGGKRRTYKGIREVKGASSRDHSRDGYPNTNDERPGPNVII